MAIISPNLRYEQYFYTIEIHYKGFYGIHIDKGIEAFLAGPKLVPISINFFALASLPSIGSANSSPLIF